MSRRDLAVWVAAVCCVGLCGCGGGVGGGGGGRAPTNADWEKLAEGVSLREDPVVVDASADPAAALPEPTAAELAELAARDRRRRIDRCMAEIPRMSERAPLRWELERLARTQHADVRQVLIAALNHEAAVIRKTAAEALQKHADAAAVLPMARRARVEAQMLAGEKRIFASDEVWTLVYLCKTLGRLGDARAVPDLIAVAGQQVAEADTDKDFSFPRCEAIDALGALKDHRALAVLRGALASKHKDVLAHAARALGELGDPADADALLALLSHKERDVRTGAAAGLGAIDDPRAVEKIIALLKSDDRATMVGDEAMWGLARRTEPRAIQALVDRAVSETHGLVPSNYTERVRILRQVTDPALIRGLIGQLTGGGRFRSRAARLLGDLKAAEAIDALCGCLGEKPWLAREAAGALGKIGDPRAVKPLIDALPRHWEDDASEGIAAALGELGDPRAVEPLIEGLWKSMTGRRRYILALGRLKAREAVGPLLRLLYNEIAGGRGSFYGETDLLIAALGEIGDPAACLPLAVLAQKADNVGTRADAIRALGRMGKPAVPYLLAARTSQSAVALGEIGDRRAVPFLVKDVAVRRHGSWEASPAVLWALLQLRDRRGLPAALRHIAADRSRHPVCRKPQVYEDSPAGEEFELWRLGKAAVPEFIDALEHMHDGGGGSIAITLGLFGDRRAVKPLMAALKRTRGDPAIVWALGALGDPAAIPAITGQAFEFGDHGTEVRALKKLGAKAAVAQYVQMLSDEERNTRCAAAVLLGQIEHPDAVEPLIAAAADRESDVRKNVAAALAHYRGRPVIGALQRLVLTEKDEMARREAVKALQTVADEGVLDWAAATLASGSPETCRRMVWYLRGVKTPRSVDLLIGALSNDDHFVRYDAIDALEKLRDPRGLDAVFGRLDDPDKFVADHAIFVIRSWTGIREEKTPAQWKAWWAQNKGKFLPQGGAASRSLDRGGSR